MSPDLPPPLLTEIQIDGSEYQNKHKTANLTFEEPLFLLQSLEQESLALRLPSETVLGTKTGSPCSAVNLVLCSPPL